MNREALHDLIDRIPEADLLAARRFLEYLTDSPAFRAAQAAPADNEEVTPEDEDAMARTDADMATGRVVQHDDVLRDFGLQ